MSVGHGFINEFRAEKAAEALHSQIHHETVAIRDRKPSTVEVTELVPGDVVELRLGGVVPADIRLLEVTSLECDESVLTGESLPVDKSADSVPAGTPLAEFVGCDIPQGAQIGALFPGEYGGAGEPVGDDGVPQYELDDPGDVGADHGEAVAVGEVVDTCAAEREWREPDLVMILAHSLSAESSGYLLNAAMERSRRPMRRAKSRRVSRLGAACRRCCVPPGGTTTVSTGGRAPKAMRQPVQHGPDSVHIEAGRNRAPQNAVNIPLDRPVAKSSSATA